MDNAYKIIFYDRIQKYNDSNYHENDEYIAPTNIYRAESINKNPVYATKNEIEEIIDKKINNLRVYVLESDITNAQNAVRTIVEQASF